jgi:three-Cys-motif partner protein
MTKKKSVVDVVGPWTDVKHEILKRYCEKYARILQNNKFLSPEYIEGFAGSGLVARLSTGLLDDGSALIALNLDPPFDHYHFVELDSAKAAHLRDLVQSSERSSRVTIYEGDCNQILLEKVFPRFERNNKRRAFCLLDPYGLHLDWSVIERAGQYGTIELMINFPAMDIEMNTLPRDPERMDPVQADRFTRFWGDESWKSIAYDPNLNLFGDLEKAGMSTLVRAFCERLQSKAGFKYVATPGKFRNGRGGVLYYMVFATNNETGHRIGDYVLRNFT